MKKITIPLLTVLFLIGCAPEPRVIQPNEIKASDGTFYKLTTIDGCQYIENGWQFSHKGNCTNKIHLYNK